MEWFQLPRVAALALVPVLAVSTTPAFAAEPAPPPVQVAPSPVVVPSSYKLPMDLGISLNDVILALRHSGNRFVRDDYAINPSNGTIFIGKGCMGTCSYIVWGTPDRITKISFNWSGSGPFSLCMMSARRMISDIKMVFQVMFPDWPQSDQWLIGTTAALVAALKGNEERERRLQRDGKMVFIQISRRQDLLFGDYSFSFDIYAPAAMAPGTPDEAAADQALRGQLVDADGQCKQAKLQALLADYCPAAAAIDAAEQESSDRVYRDYGDYYSNRFQPGDSFVLEEWTTWQDVADQPWNNRREMSLDAGTRITITSRVMVPYEDTIMKKTIYSLYYGVVGDGIPPGFVAADRIKWRNPEERHHARIQEIETSIDADLAPLRRAFWKKTGYPFWTVATPMVACGIDQACKP